ncbi:unnamed protein product [Gongylonema pulchrum]|uniref:Secreted protein n=1 Tax=Gongylonema pulchrum TaxID=637853 RepID=A0A183EM92_9BILA|nr:unnamed protein product [Gongylonema pulchrum]
MGDGGGSVIIQRCLLIALVLQFGCNVRQCWATAITSDTAIDFGGVDLPFMATAFVQTGNELHYFSDIEYHETLVSGAPVKRYHLFFGAYFLRHFQIF